MASKYAPKGKKRRLRENSDIQAPYDEGYHKRRINGTTTYTIHGKKYHGLGEVARTFKIPEGTLRKRLDNGLTMDEALKGYGVYDHLGLFYPTEEAMANFYGMSWSTYHRRKNEGWTIEDALTTPLRTSGNTNGRNTYDHKGNHYNSVKEMCKAYNIDYGTFYKRLKKGWSIPKALLTPKGTRDKKGE